jgi:hypothetical protein
MPQIICKHMMSGATDTLVDYEVDRETKTVSVSMFNGRTREPIVSMTALESLVFRLLRDEDPGKDVIAFNNDDNGEWTPTRTSWKVIASLGEQKFLVEAWQQRPAASFHAVEIVLRPVAEASP